MSSQLLDVLDEDQLVAWDRDVDQADVGERAPSAYRTWDHDRTEHVTVFLSPISSDTELYYYWAAKRWVRSERWACLCGARSTWLYQQEAQDMYTTTYPEHSNDCPCPLQLDYAREMNSHYHWMHG